ncbi:MAG: hypothetical protein K8F62_12185 [Pseudorhodoplanes sp.]|nr:hypothetical protein [Pseudorhodoplanes sp.]
MTAEIITFEALRQKTYRAPPRAPEPDNRSQIAKNEDLRRDRKEAWRKADALTNFWRASLDFFDAVSRAHDHGLKDARGLARTSHEERWPILERYREAMGKHLLTPAPDMAAVTWKRQQLGKTYLGVKKELVEKSIADDIAFLDAHPTRNSRANKLRKGESR